MAMIGNILFDKLVQGQVQCKMKTRNKTACCHQEFYFVAVFVYSCPRCLLLLALIFNLATPTLAAFRCNRNSRCQMMKQQSCCVSVNHGVAVCQPKIGIGQRCSPTIKPVILYDGSIVQNRCGCSSGLTCTRVMRKARKRFKKRKRPLRQKYKCLPSPTEAPELSEFHIYNA